MRLKLFAVISVALLWMLNHKGHTFSVQNLEDWTALIVDGRHVRCQAVFISRYRAITAKHCLEQNADRLMVYKPDQGTFHAIENVIPYYPLDWDRFPSHDLAVVNLRSPLPQLRDWPLLGLKPVSTKDPIMARFIARADDCMIEACTRHDPTLMKVDTPIHSMRYHNLLRVSVQQGPGPCSKDSGSGIFAIKDSKVHLVALVAGLHGTLNDTAEGCASDNFLATDLAPYRSWLLKPELLTPKALDPPSLPAPDWETHCQTQQLDDPTWLQTEELILQLLSGSHSSTDPNDIQKFCRLAGRELQRRIDAKEALTIEPDLNLELYSSILAPLRTVKLFSPSADTLKALQNFKQLERLEIIGDVERTAHESDLKNKSLLHLALRQSTDKSLSILLVLYPWLRSIELDAVQTEQGGPVWNEALCKTSIQALKVRDSRLFIPSAPLACRREIQVEVQDSEIQIGNRRLFISKANTTFSEILQGTTNKNPEQR